MINHFYWMINILLAVNNLNDIAEVSVTVTNNC